MTESDLTLEIMGKGNMLPPFSSRECKQTLTLLPQGLLRRTINGNLVCIGFSGHRKFQSTISCRDKTAPSLSGVWKGTKLKVGCLQFLTQSVLPHTEEIKLERLALSSQAYDQDGNPWPLQSVNENSVKLDPAFPGGYVTYRPSLIMLVQNYQLETDEWGATVGWALELEEE